MITLPPLNYDHPCDCIVMEQTLSAQDVEAICNLHDVQACMLDGPAFKGDKCFIILPFVGPGGVAKRTQDLLREHEIGHCNGWPKNHPNAR